MRIICHGLTNEDFPVEFTGHRIVLGRAKMNDITIQTTGVAKRHAFLIEDGGELFIQDNKSPNGTFHNYNRIVNREKLSSGDIIHLGIWPIRVDFSSDETVVLDFSPDSGRAFHGVKTPRSVPDNGDDDSGELTVLPDSDPATLPPPDDSESATFLPDSDLATLPPPDYGDDDSGSATLPPDEESSTDSKPSGLLQKGVIGQYEVTKMIKTGGVTDLYLAHDATRQCVIKVLHPEFARKTKSVDRFIRAAGFAAEVDHPNVVHICSSGKEPDIGPYIVMEYLDGGSLRDILRNRRAISEEQAVVVVRAIASALSALGKKGIIHCDVKPDNILFTKEGGIKLSDFEIAKKLSEPLDDAVCGTPAYMSPEQIQFPLTIDLRTDIYGLGATFYELLTGQRPYPFKKVFEAFNKAISDPVPNPRKINRGISRATAKIIMKMLAKAPEDRFPNADKLLEALDQVFPQQTAEESAEQIKKMIAGGNNVVDDNETRRTNHDFAFGDSETRRNRRSPVKRKTEPRRNMHKSDNNGFISDKSDDEFRDDSAFDFPPIPPDLGFKYKIANLERRNRKLRKLAVVEAILLLVVVLFVGVAVLISWLVPGMSAHAGKHDLTIKSAPDSAVFLLFPDGRTGFYSLGPSGRLRIPHHEAGKYEINVLKEGCRLLSKIVELDSDQELDMPLTPDQE